jgi:beta-glucanase (GH16 family)
MKIVPSGTQGSRRIRRRLLSLRTIQIIMVALIAIFSLVGDARLGGIPAAKPGLRIAVQPTPTATAKATLPQTPIPTPTPVPTAGPAQSNLVWNDEFDGPAGAPPNPGKWNPETGGGGWGSHQLQYYTNNQNAYQDGQGNLVIETRQEDPAGSQCWYGSCQYTSARLTTSGNFSFTYGRIEARIKIPSGQGMWPTFWLLGQNYGTVGWPDCGEMDVMENVGKEPGRIYGTIHGPGYLHSPEYLSSPFNLQQGAFSDGFHIFTLQWDPNYLYFFVDGINYKTVDRATQTYWVYDHPFNIVLNVAIGGDWPGSPDTTTVFPQKMYISYVRLYQDR